VLDRRPKTEDCGNADKGRARRGGDTAHTDRGDSRSTDPRISSHTLHLLEQDPGQPSSHRKSKVFAVLVRWALRRLKALSRVVASCADRGQCPADGCYRIGRLDDFDRTGESTRILAACLGQSRSNAFPLRRVRSGDLGRMTGSSGSGIVCELRGGLRHGHGDTRGKQ
jgi:hypothetical protein